MPDRSEQYLKIVKDGKVAFVGKKGEKQVNLNKLKVATEYPKGAYKAHYDVNGDMTLSKQASDPVDSPAFKTKISAPSEPSIKLDAGLTNIKVTITHGSSDGAPDNNKQDIKSYVIQSHAKGEEFGNPVTVTDLNDKGDASYNITGLKSSTEYTVRVKATNADGESDYGKATKTVTTRTPQKPKAPSVSLDGSPTSNKANIIVKSNGAGDSAITGYKVYLNVKDASHVDSISINSKESTVKQELGSLTQATSYVVKATAISSVGESPQSSELDFTTATIHPESVSLDKTNLSLKPGDKAKLVATVKPDNAKNKGVNWASDDEKVVTVDNSGNVTAVANGDANVKVGTKDGNKSAQAKVAVRTPVTGVSLDKTTLGIDTGATGQLTATVAPASASNKAVTWTSNATSVATVDDTGKVTGVKAGTANVTVKTADGGKTASSKVTVTDPVVHPTGVTLDKATASLHPGDTVQLTATVAPSNASSKAVTWSSSDETLATVDNTGKVTAKANGSATITVTTTDGSKTATAKITVTTLVTGVSLDKTEANPTVGDTVQLKATVKPDSASDKSVTWKSSDESKATVDGNGKVTTKAVGEVAITVTTKNGSKTASCKLTIKATTTTSTSTTTKKPTTSTTTTTKKPETSTSTTSTTSTTAKPAEG